MIILNYIHFDSISGNFFFNKKQYSRKVKRAEITIIVFAYLIILSFARIVKSNSSAVVKGGKHEKSRQR